MHLTNCPPPLVERTKQEQSALHRRKEREVEQAVRLEDMEAAAAAVVANGNHTVPATTAAAAGAASIGRAAVRGSSIDGGMLAEPATTQAQVHQPSLHPSLTPTMQARLQRLQALWHAQALQQQQQRPRALQRTRGQT
jgi:hypothetical protein